MNRVQAAEVLDVSKSGVRMFEEQGLLRPIAGVRGEVRFRREEVEELARARAATDATAAELELSRKRARAFSADVFKAVAEKLNAGKAPLDVVLDVDGLTPEAFWACAEAYQRLCGAFLVTPEQARELGGERFRVSSGAEVVDCVRYLRQMVDVARRREGEACERAVGKGNGFFIAEDERAALEHLVGDQTMRVRGFRSGIPSAAELQKALECVFASMFVCARCTKDPQGRGLCLPCASSYLQEIVERRVAESWSERGVTRTGANGTSPVTAVQLDDAIPAFPSTRATEPRGTNGT